MHDRAMDASTPIDPDELPAVVRGYLAAHAARDHASAFECFGSHAVVVDDGRAYRGAEGVREFLGRAGAEFTYTTELVEARQVDDRRWVVTNHLEGDFPGGVVDLRLAFTIDHDRITELAIAP